MMKLIKALFLIISVTTKSSLANTDTCTCSLNSESLSLYELYCCARANGGLGIKIVEENKINFVLCPSDVPSSCPDSCSGILSRNSSASSGYYDILLSNGSLTSVYCDMEGSYCDGEGGWTRVAYLNMTEPGAVCPEGLVQKNFSTFPHDLCGKVIPKPDCSSALFDSYSIPYTKVCGQVRGYQFGHTDGLYNLSPSIDDYVAGISITYSEGQQRKHIWTYICGENQDQALEDDCPCNSGSTVVVPSFVGVDYYCESGHGTNLTNKLIHPYEIFFPDDALWDGEKCEYLEAPCCTDTRLPWFYRRLNASTSSDIEVRVCGRNDSGEDVPVDIIEIFVK